MSPVARLQKLFDALRAACPPGIWSQAVKFAREGSVSAPEATGGSLTFRVQVPGRVAPTVTLYPNDLEWTCDCAGKVDPCSHVAAAAIAATQGSAREGAS